MTYYDPSVTAFICVVLAVRYGVPTIYHLCKAVSAVNEADNDAREWYWRRGQGWRK